VPFLRVVSANVAGFRSVLCNDLKKGAFQNLVDRLSPDILCIQEHKLQHSHVNDLDEDLKSIVPDYQCYWSCSGPPAKKGYSGVACFVKIKSIECVEQKAFNTVLDLSSLEPMPNSKTDRKNGSLKSMWNKKSSALGNENEKENNSKRIKLLNVTRGLGKAHEYDSIATNEGRVITMEFEHMYVVNAYVPNSGQDLKRLEYRTENWDKKFGQYLKSLEKMKPVVLIGDMNVAHRTEDLHNFYSRPEFPNLPMSLEAYTGVKQLLKQAGCTLVERESFSSLLDLGFVDTFRFFNPEAQGCFTYWSMRANNRPANRGLRLDYCIASRNLCVDVDAYGDNKKKSKPGIYVGDSFILDDLDQFPSFSDHCPVGCTIVGN